MKIKDRLALHFTLISTGLLLVVLCSVYFIFLKFLQADFYARLTDRTMVTAKLYLEADEISRDALNKVRSQYLNKLSDEVIRIYDSNNKATFIGDRAQYWTNDTIDKVRSAGKLQFKDGDRQVVGIFYKDNQGDFVIIAAATDLSSISRLGKLAKIMLAAFILIALLLLLTGRWIADKILLPLRHFMDDVKKVGSANLEFRVKESETKDEVNQLAQSFNRLMEELEQAFILQKTFVANASHELRTPITSVIMTTELALSKERQVTEYQKILESILEDTSRMENTITGLLTLAKMDLELSGAQLVPLQLDQILVEIKTEWEKRNNLTIKLSIAPTADRAKTLANNTLLLIALNNVIANAFKFSNDQPINISLDSSADHHIISITDTGIGINPDELNSIFKPFYSRAKQVGKNGEGMGLYMSAKIINLFKGALTVASQIGQGSTFSINLPKL